MSIYSKNQSFQRIIIPAREGLCFNLVEAEAVDDLSFRPDVLTEAMVATASGYFLADRSLGTETPREFRQSVRNLYDNDGREGRRLLAAGLLAAGFTIEVAPLVVGVPAVEPAEALDTQLLHKNWRSVAATVIDMGLRVVTHDHPSYNSDIVDLVMRSI